MNVFVKSFFTAIVFASCQVVVAAGESPKLIEGNGVSVTEKDLEQYIENFLKANKQASVPKSVEEVQQLVDLLYSTRVLSSESLQVSEVDSESVKWMGKFQVDSILKEALLKVEAQKSLEKINFENTAKDLYGKQSEQFKNEVELHLAHILISTRGISDKEALDKISELKKQVGNGDDFLEFAKEHSQDPSAKRNGGDLGFLGRGKTVKPFEDAAFALSVGEISEPIKSRFGYHIIKLLDKRGGDVKPFEEVKGAIVKELKLQLASKYKVNRVSSIAAAATKQPSKESLEKIVAKYTKKQEQ